MRHLAGIVIPFILLGAAHTSSDPKLSIQSIAAVKKKAVSSNVRLAVNNRKRRCLRKIRLLVTAYDRYLRDVGANPSRGMATGYTRYGLKAHYGIAATDPRVIKPGTWLRVPGYGICLAADTGGAIKGHHIDVCYNNPKPANRWGSKHLIVEVLGWHSLRHRKQRV